MDTSILKDKWLLESIYGEAVEEKPGLCLYKNISYAIDLLHKHIENNSNMVMHTDVDVDGIGSTYILKKFMNSLGANKQILMINKDKEHGIKQKHVDYINGNSNLGIELVIVTDSSSNEIELIKQFNCDVLCIDHHDLLHNDLLGYCNDNQHRYVIVNSTIENDNFDFDKQWLTSKNNEAFTNVEKYTGTDTMSCGLVIYELLRVYCECFSNQKLIENLLLYQWSAITLFTDAINTKTHRNQYYLDKTIYAKDIESTLKIIMSEVNKYTALLNKTFINYSLAPIINKAIRAGAGAEALDIVINRPKDIKILDKYKETQETSINRAITVNGKKRVFNEDTIKLDISNLPIHQLNYNGVIASRLVGENHKNTVVFTKLENGRLRGSFRGRQDNCDYRSFFAEYSPDIYAQGHAAAFGFEATQEQLDDIMSKLNTIEDINDKTYISFGHIEDSEKGTYHIDSIDELRKDGFLLKLATGNSKVKSTDEIKIKVSVKDIKLKEVKGRVFIYDLCGLECIAYSSLEGNYFEIYPENTDVIKIYIK